MSEFTKLCNRLSQFEIELNKIKTNLREGGSAIGTELGSEVDQIKHDLLIITDMKSIETIKSMLIKECEPVCVKFMNKLEEKDPITDLPRYGPTMKTKIIAGHEKLHFLNSLVNDLYEVLVPLNLEAINRQKERDEVKQQQSQQERNDDKCEIEQVQHDDVTSLRIM